MSEAAVEGVEQDFLQRNHFLLRKLHSLAGLIPLGVFILKHFWANAHILTHYGPVAFNEQKEEIHGYPGFNFIEWAIFIPLAFHAFYGLAIWLQAKNNTTAYQYTRNVFYSFQRWTGVIIFAFLIIHIWFTRVQEAFFGSYVDARYMYDYLATWYIFAIYVVGVLATTFHFGNGLWNMGITWGVTIGPKAQRLSMYAAMMVFGVLAATGVAVAIEFFSGM